MSGGTDIGYYQNDIVRKIVKHGKKSEEEFYYTLHFSYEFQNDNDEVIIAQSIPYSYGNMATLLKDCHLYYSNICKIENMCNTFANNKCPAMIITEHADAHLGVSYYRDLIEKPQSSLKHHFHKLNRIKKLIMSKKLSKSELLKQTDEIQVLEAKLSKLGANLPTDEEGIILFSCLHQKSNSP